MAKGKTDEEKQEDFDKWQSTEEYMALTKLQGIMQKMTKQLELSDIDIWSDMQPFLDQLFEIVQIMKVPGKKAKDTYLQMYVRTMFFEKKEFVIVNGKKYEISNGVQVDIYNCKTALVDVSNCLQPDQMGMECVFDTFTTWRKDLIKLLKEWDKVYVKHIKAAYPEMSKHHSEMVEPLTRLINSNLNFYKLEQMIARKEDVPPFRYNALETEFCTDFTGVCQILKEYGTLGNPFDIRQMLKTLKIENWRQIRPFEHYLTPLKAAIDKVRTTYRDMHKLGHLRIRYVIEENKAMAAEVEDMVKKDMIAQMLMGDELKQDQFKFFYDTVKIIYDSALQDKLVNIMVDKTPIIQQTVIPELIAFKAVLRIRDIQLTKYNEAKAAKEKAERDGRPVEVAAEIDPTKMTEEQILAQRLENEGQPASMSEKQALEEADRKERKMYGRYWIWDGYFNEKNKQQWLDTAEQLKHINDHVLQDIEDYLLLKAFGKEKPEKIKQIIEDDHRERINRAKNAMENGADEFELKANEHIKRRHFMSQYRPPQYWNFKEDGPEDLKVKHVLRYNANPIECYSDGRVETVIQNIVEIGNNLRGYEEIKWNQMFKQVWEIFEKDYKNGQQ